jgi:hypothetical protein
MNSIEELYYRRYLNDLVGTPGSLDSSMSDPLNIADSNGGIGYKWIQGSKPPTGSTVFPLDVVVSTITTSSKPGDTDLCLAWAIRGNTNPQTDWRGFALPLNIYTICLGQTQYVQCTLVYTTGVSGQGTIQAGIAVQFYGATQKVNGYVFNVSSDNHNWLLQRFNDDVALTLTSGGPISDGDIFRMNSQVSSSQVIVTVTRNATLLTSYTDTSGSKLSYGSPSLWAYGTKGNGSPHSEWRTFSAGIGI